MSEYVTIQIPVRLAAAIQCLATEIGRLAENSSFKAEDVDTGGPTGTEEKPYDEQEVVRFCRENNLTIDAHRFYTYYQARGWKAKGYPFDWKQKAIDWQSYEKDRATPKTSYKVSSYKTDADGNYMPSGDGDDLELAMKAIGMMTLEESDEDCDTGCPQN